MAGHWYGAKLTWMGPLPYELAFQVILNSFCSEGEGACNIVLLTK